jgi:hypothetical protein
MNPVPWGEGKPEPVKQPQTPPTDPNLIKD